MSANKVFQPIVLASLRSARPPAEHRRWASLAMRLLILLLVAASGSAAAQIPASEPLPEAQHSTIGYKNVAEALAALKTKAGANVQVQQGWTIVTDKDGSNPVMWSFAPESNPAYPAVAKRTVVEKNGEIFIEMNVHCEGSKSACDQFVRDFQALNAKMREEMQRRKK